VEVAEGPFSIADTKADFMGDSMDESQYSPDEVVVFSGVVVRIRINTI